MVQENELENDLDQREERPLPIVAVVGRPNVGKSSLFNRILSRRHAIVSDVAGTTRDRLMSEVEWEDYRFIMVDTGGLESDPEGHIREMVQEQADMAMSGADVIVFVTDAADGMTPTDQEIADRLRRARKPVILAVNKVDNDRREVSASEFYQIGLADTVMISAYHNYGIYDLMDRVMFHLPVPEYVPPTDDDDDWYEDSEDEEGISVGPPVPASAKEMRLAIVGRTNVGKSMLLNAVLGQDRAIVSERGWHHPGCPRYPDELPRPLHHPDRHRRHPAAGTGAAGHRKVQRDAVGERR